MPHDLGSRTVRYLGTALIAGGTAMIGIGVVAGSVVTLRDTSGTGDPVPKRLRNPRRAYDSDGRMITPATIGNVQENGAVALTATCACGHEAAVPLDRFSRYTFVPDAGLRMKCSACGRRGVATVPVWRKLFVPGT